MGYLAAAAGAKELSKLQAQVAKGDGSKAERRAQRDRLSELKAAPAAEREYRVSFTFPAAARRLAPPLITLSKVAFAWGGGGGARGRAAGAAGATAGGECAHHAGHQGRRRV